MAGHRSGKKGKSKAKGGKHRGKMSAATKAKLSRKAKARWRKLSAAAKKKAVAHLHRGGKKRPAKRKVPKKAKTHRKSRKRVLAGKKAARTRRLGKPWVKRHYAAAKGRLARLLGRHRGGKASGGAKCGYCKQNPGKGPSCQHCGAKKCAYCGSPNTGGTKCGNCGAPYGPRVVSGGAFANRIAALDVA